MNYDYWLCRASSLYKLFTDPKTKEAKEKGELSETAKAYMYDVYLEAKYGIREDVMTKEMQKGHIVEGKIIDILSDLDGKVGKDRYIKNDERKSNEWIQGECDVDAITHIDDAKACWDMSTLIPYFIEPLQKVYHYQSQGYMWLWDRPQGKVSRVMVDCPVELYKDEVAKLYWKSGVIWEGDPKFLIPLEKLRRQLIVEDYIPLEERVCRKEVIRDEAIISAIPGKVDAARRFLHEIARLHSRTPQRILTATEVKLIKIKK